jgi:hypothetical protein
VRDTLLHRCHISACFFFLLGGRSGTCTFHVISSNVAAVGSRPWHPGSQRPCCPVKGPGRRRFVCQRQGFHLSKQRTLTLCFGGRRLIVCGLYVGPRCAPRPLSQRRFLSIRQRWPCINDFPPKGHSVLFTKKKKSCFSSQKKNSHRLPSAAFPPSPLGGMGRDPMASASIFQWNDQWAHPIGRALSVRFPRENGCHPIGLLCLPSHQVYLAASELTSAGGRRGADAEADGSFSFAKCSAHRSETRCVTSDVTEAT